MGKFTTVTEKDDLILQVDGDMYKNTIKADVFKTYTYEMAPAGVKNLTASVIAKADLKKLDFDATGTVKYVIKMEDGGSIEIGVRCNLTKGEIVIPMLVHSKNGFTAGIEVKATLDPMLFHEMGVNLVLGIPFGGGQLMMKWNPLTEKFTVQLRAAKPKKDEPEEDDVENPRCMNYVFELNAKYGLVIREFYASSHVNHFKHPVAPLVQTQTNTGWNFWEGVNNLVDYVRNKLTTNDNDNNYAYN